MVHNRNRPFFADVTSQSRFSDASISEGVLVTFPVAPLFGVVSVSPHAVALVADATESSIPGPKGHLLLGLRHRSLPFLTLKALMLLSLPFYLLFVVLCLLLMLPALPQCLRRLRNSKPLMLVIYLTKVRWFVP